MRCPSVEDSGIPGLGPAALPRLRRLLRRGDEVGQKRCGRTRIMPGRMGILTTPAKRNEAASGFATAFAVAPPSHFRPARHN
jgi:hypothetical protein